MSDERQQRLRYYIFAAVVGVLLAANWLGFWKTLFGIDTAVLITLLAGYKTFYNSVSALLEKRISADIALCLAVIAALAVGEYLAAAEAMFIVLVGEGLESYAAGRTEAAIERFVQQLPPTARLLASDGERVVPADSLQPGDRIAVRAGERIPADGLIEDGRSDVQEASVTGEPLPLEKQSGDEVYSGTLNGAGLLRVRVTRGGADTTLARVIALVRQAKEQRAPVERLADRVAVYFLPALLLAAAATFWFTRDWLRTVSVLVVACPCALILATPTAMVAAMGALARRGILVRGGAALQRAAAIETIVFDKTGTLTEGHFEITRLRALDGDEEQLLRLAAAAESASDHPLARVIVDAARARGLAAGAVTEAQVVAGRGASASLEGRLVLAGNAAWLRDNAIQGVDQLLEEFDRTLETPVLVAYSGRLAGAVLLRDRLRDGARRAVTALHQLGLGEVVILTGDRAAAAYAVAREAGIERVEAELLPEQKLERVRALVASSPVAMVGDGINDAPALAAASLGIAMAGAADIAAEAADVVYLPHSLDPLPVLFETARRAVRTAWQNIVVFAGLVNLIAIALAASGTLGPAGAAFTHQMSSFLVMLNSLRLLRAADGERPAWRTRVAGWYERSRLPAAFRRVRALVNGIEFDALAAATARWALANRRYFRKPAAAAAGTLFLLSGFYSIGPEETGVIERFGRKLTPYSEPGLHYKLPWPVERLTRIQAHRVRVVEIGFRSNSARFTTEPDAYEWNVQHRDGRYQRVQEEALMLTGDQNMIECNATVHYAPERPDDFLFRQADGDTTVRVAAESVLQSIVTAARLDDLLTTGRGAIEQRAAGALQQRLDRYRAGVKVLRVKLQDVHPSLEVVDAFRDVAGAFEEKSRLVNEAEGYRNEQVSLARGTARASLVNAAAYRIGRARRAEGDAARFRARETAYRAAPAATETRIYFETIEEVLPGKRKLIVDKSTGRKRLMLLEDGVVVPSPATPAQEQ